MKLKRYKELLRLLGLKYVHSNGAIHSSSKDGITIYTNKYKRIIVRHESYLIFEKKMSNTSEEEFIESMINYLQTAKQMSREKRLKKILNEN